MWAALLPKWEILRLLAKGQALYLDFGKELYKREENNEGRKLINEITKGLITPISHSSAFAGAIISEWNGEEDLRKSRQKLILYNTANNIRSMF